MACIAFLRAINVGGSSIVRMADLREAFVTAGCRNVRSYIASGNILFESGVSNDVALVRRVRRAIADRLEMNPAIMLHALKELEALVARDPFRKLRQDHAAKFYVAFLAERPAASVNSAHPWEGSARRHRCDRAGCFHREPPEAKRILRVP